MKDFFVWFTDLENSKTAAAVIFFTLFVCIIIYVFTSKTRKEQYDEYRFIPLRDEGESVPAESISKKEDSTNEQ